MFPRCFFGLIPFPVSLAGARLGAADDCSWKPEGAPKHVLFWGKMVGLEIVPGIIMQCFCVACGSAFILMYKSVPARVTCHDFSNCCCCRVGILISQVLASASDSLATCSHPIEGAIATFAMFVPEPVAPADLGIAQAYYEVCAQRMMEELSEEDKLEMCLAQDSHTVFY